MCRNYYKMHNSSQLNCKPWTYDKYDSNQLNAIVMSEWWRWYVLQQSA